MAKLNCWEFKKCGREAGGANVAEFGVCPAALEIRLHEVHGGKNAGRACWVVSGSLCDDRVQGTFARKYGNCIQCDFYKKVEEEEGQDYQLSINLLYRLKKYRK